MKKYICGFVSVVVILCGFARCNSSNKKENYSYKKLNPIVNKSSSKIKTALTDTLQYVNAAEKYLDSINLHLKDFVLKKEDTFGGSAEGGEINVYKDKTDTIKIKAIFYGETGKSEYSIYLKDKKMVVFKEEAAYYKAPIGRKPIKIDSVSVKTFVLNNEHVINAKNDKGDIIEAAHYEQKAIDIKEIYKEIMLQIKE